MADNTTLPPKSTRHNSNEEDFVIPKDPDASLFHDGKWVPISDLSYRINWYFANQRAEGVVKGLKKVLKDKDQRLDDPSKAIVEKQLQYWEAQHTHAVQVDERIDNTEPGASVRIDRCLLCKIAVEASLFHFWNRTDLDAKEQAIASQLDKFYEDHKAEWEQYGLAQDRELVMPDGKTNFVDYVRGFRGVNFGYNTKDLGPEAEALMASMQN